MGLENAVGTLWNFGLLLDIFGGVLDIYCKTIDKIGTDVDDSDPAVGGWEDSWATLTEATRNSAKLGGAVFVDVSSVMAIADAVARRLRHSFRQSNLSRRRLLRMQPGQLPQPWMMRQILQILPLQQWQMLKLHSRRRLRLLRLPQVQCWSSREPTRAAPWLGLRWRQQAAGKVALQVGGLGDGCLHGVHKTWGLPDAACMRAVSKAFGSLISFDLEFNQLQVRKATSVSDIVLSLANGTTSGVEEVDGGIYGKCFFDASCGCGIPALTATYLVLFLRQGSTRLTTCQHSHAFL